MPTGMGPLKDGPHLRPGHGASVWDRRDRRDRPTVEALARRVNGAIGRDRYGTYRRAGIKPLPTMLVMVPWDPADPNGRIRPATRQSGGPNRADRRMADGKHQRKLDRRAALESAARVAAKAANA